MGKNRYNLFGRDKDTNEVKLIPLSDYDIYKFGTDVRRKDNNLEAIDYMTLIYNNQEELVYYLVSTGRLDNYNTELFIVSRNGNNINYLENVYSNFELASELTRVSEEKLKGLPNSYSNDAILDRFAFMMINDREFRKFIESRYHKVYSKYVDYFYGCYNTSDAYNVKYNNSVWARGSYPLLRNIVEAINRYEKIKDRSNNIVDSALYYEIGLSSLRDKSAGDISIYTDKGCGEGQLSLFMNNEESNKAFEVADFLYQIDTDSFILENDKIIFNKDKFDCSDMELRQLNNLDSRLLRLLYLFLITKKFNEIDGYSELTVNNITTTVIANIQKLLTENENLLNRAHAFCLLYSRLSNHKINSKIYQKVKGE